MRRFVFGILLVAVVTVIGSPRQASAHADPERATPAIEATVPDAPFTVEVWFTEEVTSDGTSLTVTGPDGMRVDNQDSRVDLNDPERKHVTVTLQPGLGDGVYTVNWTSMSAEDGDASSGFFIFTVGSASPVASPVAAASEPTALPTPIPQPESTTENPFPARELGIAVGVGTLVGLGIYLFWRLVRPRS